MDTCNENATSDNAIIEQGAGLCNNSSELWFQLRKKPNSHQLHLNYLGKVGGLNQWRKFSFFLIFLCFLKEAPCHSVVKAYSECPPAKTCSCMKENFAAVTSLSLGGFSGRFPGPV